MFSSIQIAPRGRISFLAFLAVFLLGGFCGCGGEEQEVVFTVKDQNQALLDSVRVFYQNEEGEIKECGPTIDGKITIKGEDLKNFSEHKRSFSFEKNRIPREHRKRFDEDNCTMVTESSFSWYRFTAKKGKISEFDFAEKKSIKRSIEMTLEPYLEGQEHYGWHVTATSSCFRKLDITTTPNAIVVIGENIPQEIPSDGHLMVEFCPGDSASCMADNIEIRITKSEFLPIFETLPLPDHGETIKLENLLELVPPQNTFTKVRISNHAYLQSCGEEYPVLQINHPSTVISRSSNSKEMESDFDVILKAGETYCVAVTCPGNQENELRSPWVDPTSQPKKPGWFHLKIPSGAKNVEVEIKPGTKNGESLTVKILGSEGNPGFQTGYTISSGCVH